MRAVLVAIVLAGCTLHSAGDHAYMYGNYLAAQDLFDKEFQRNPTHRDALVKRDEARNAYVRVLLYRFDAARAQKRDDDARAQIAELLERRDAWQLAVDPRVVPQIAAAVDAIGRQIEGDIAERAQRVGPLAAAQAAHGYDKLLAFADFAGSVRAIDDLLTAAGKRRCAELKPTTPYASWVVARYCAHFGVDREVLPRPNAASSLVVDGAIRGEDAEQAQGLRDVLARAFSRSAWFDERAPDAAHAVVDGSIAAAFGAHPVTRVKTWLETVEYTDYETRQEPYEEPYTDVETYTESVPSTEYRTTTTSCGTTTCTTSVPETVYHSETKTRTVTKYRTAYRTVTEPVTKTREEQRDFTYAATERVAQYESALHLRVDRGVPVTTAETASSFGDAGDDHDVTYPEAGLIPQRANLMTFAIFVIREHGQLADRLREALDRRYVEQYCAQAAYTVESAAACAYGDPAHAPPAVHAALSSLLGGDEPFAAPLLIR